MRPGFDPLDGSTWNDEERAVYETGYREGESSVEADWAAALDEGCDLPEGVAPTPMAVAAYIARLTATSRSRILTELDENAARFAGDGGNGYVVELGRA